MNVIEQYYAKKTPYFFNEYSGNFVAAISVYLLNISLKTVMVINLSYILA